MRCLYVQSRALKTHHERNFIMKKALIFVCVLATVFAMTACSARRVEWNGETDYTHVMLSIDEANMYQYVGTADYVFVGKVTRARTAITSDNDKSSYKITVTENLKGELVDKIVCQKHGGLLPDGTMVLYATDSAQDTGLPRTGDTYIFMAYAQPDGSLLLSELYGNVEYTEARLAEYRGYVEHQQPDGRRRFVSKYDAAENK